MPFVLAWCEFAPCAWHTGATHVQPQWQEDNAKKTEEYGSFHAGTMKDQNPDASLELQNRKFEEEEAAIVA